MVDSRYTGVGYEPPFETPSDKDFMAAHIEALEAKLARLVDGVQEVVNRGEVFDAKGSHSKWVCDKLKDAIAAAKGTL